MRLIAALTVASLSLASIPAKAETSQLKSAMMAGITACQMWILEPSTWAESPKNFASKAGLSEKLNKVDAVPNGIFPSQLVASSTYFWRVDAGSGNGVFVAASDTSPVCNVAGGGPSDFEPDAELLVTDIKQGRDWKSEAHKTKADMATDTFNFSADAKGQLIISRAARPGDRTDRVQFIATVLYQIRN